MFHDRTGASAWRETTLALDALPSPAELWSRYRAWKGLDDDAERAVLQDYYDDGGGKPSSDLATGTWRSIRKQADLKD